MKLFRGAIFFLLFIGQSLNYSASAQALNDSVLLGTWQGLVYSLMGDFRIVINFERNNEKQLTATFENPDISTKKREVDVEVIGDSIALDITGGHGNSSYNAVYNKDSAAFFGKYAQRGFKSELKLIKGKADDLLYHRPQTPKEPFPYHQEEVTIVNKKANDTLAGTFTKPNGSGIFPTVILITGSGAQDRDEKLFAHKPFLVIADYLTRKGFAVLRCDDRGTAKSTGDFHSSTTLDFVGDAQAQFDYLKKRPDVDKNSIGIIGHSEGGMIATMMAAKNKDLGFIVLMAGPAMDIYDLMIMQDSMVAMTTGYTDKTIGPYLDRQKKIFKIAMNVKDTTDAFNQIDKLLTDEKASEREIEASIKKVIAPWFRWFIKYDPEKDLKKVRCPVLSIGGDKDVQVPAVANAASFEMILKSSRNKNYKSVVLPGLNHLFQHCNSCKVGEYGKLDETINPAALSAVGDWMEVNAKKPKH